MIWRKARGKERDALLWGDEVRSPSPQCGLITKSSQIEYLVVAIDDEHKKVRLSLSQAEVLEALAKDGELSKQDSVVPDLQDGRV